MFDELCEAVAEAWSPQRFAAVTSLVAVSGGADSVALLRALLHVWPAGCAGRLIVAHYNHRLRGDNSDGDESFVRDLAGQLGLGCIVDCAAAAQRVPADPVSEDSLRRARYAFFDQTARRVGARYLAVAHTADDNLETMLHNLFRGTGPAGLAGMPQFRPLGDEAVLVRPMLQVRRQTIRYALQAIGQDWRNDASNDDPHWNRNWLRGELLPRILERYGHADQAILRTAAQQNEMIEAVRELADAFASQRIHLVDRNRMQICRGAWGLDWPRHPPRSAVVLALRDAWDRQQWPRGEMAERHWKLLLGMLQGGDPHMANLPGNLRARLSPGGKVVVERLVAD